MKPSIAILGASGAFGRFFTKLLRGEGWSVIGVDQVDPRSDVPADERASTFVQGDACALSPALRDVLGGVDYVLVSLPEKVALLAAPGIVAAMRDDAVWVDVVAVKGPISAILARTTPSRESVSIHPIFAPQAGLAGQTVLAVDVHAGERARGFVSLLGRLGADVVWIDADTHDKHLASVQCATHAALLAFGHALTELSYDADAGATVATKPHRSLVALLSRVLSFNADAYWEVQESNPHAPAARAALRRGIDALDRLVGDEDVEGFRERFAAMGHALGSRLPEHAAICAKMFTVVEPPPRAAPPSLESYRAKIDALDGVLLEALGRRLDLCRDVARFKRDNGIPMMQRARVDEVKTQRAKRGVDLGLDAAFTRQLYDTIIDEACRLEDAIIDAKDEERGQ